MGGNHEIFTFKSVAVAAACAACGEDLTATVHAAGDHLYHESCCPHCHPAHLPEQAPAPTEGEQVGMFDEPKREGYPD